MSTGSYDSSRSSERLVITSALYPLLAHSPIARIWCFCILCSFSNPQSWKGFLGGLRGVYLLSRGDYGGNSFYSQSPSFSRMTYTAVVKARSKHCFREMQINTSLLRVLGDALRFFGLMDSWRWWWLHKKSPGKVIMTKWKYWLWLTKGACPSSLVAYTKATENTIV